MCDNCLWWEPEPEPIKPGDIKYPDRPSKIKGGVIPKRKPVGKDSET